MAAKRFDGICAVGGEELDVDSSGAAMDHDQQRVFASGVVIGGLDEDTFNQGAAGGRPLDDFAGSEAVVLVLRCDIGEDARGEVGDGRSEDFGEAVGAAPVAGSRRKMLWAVFCSEVK